MHERLDLGSEPDFPPQRAHAKDGDKLHSDEGMPGAGLTLPYCRKVPSDMPSLKPYWGKPTVRNFREGDGNVGIIRSPVSAITLPGWCRYAVLFVPGEISPRNWYHGGFRFEEQWCLK